MRTQQEILERVKARSEKDLFGFEVDEYFRALTRESIETLKGVLIKEDADLSDFNPDLTTDEGIRKQCIGYLDFAWEKANGFRGLSANRSILHYQAWIWLLGEDWFDEIAEDYEFYGKDQLRRICQFLEVDPDRWDDGIRVNSESELDDDDDDSE